MLLGKIILLVSALVFTAYGLVSLISPATPAGFAGLLMTNGDAFTEIGSMYGGLQTGIGLYCALAAFRTEFYRPGLALLAIAIGALALARLISIFLAPDPVSAYSLGAFAYELLTALLASIALLKTSR